MASTGRLDMMVTAHNRRLRRLDPLLRAAGPLHPTVDSPLLAAAGGFAVVTRNRPDPQSLDATWTTAAEERITLRVGERDPAGAAADLLSAWARRVQVAAAAGDWDSSAILTWPSRDAAMTPVFLRHGLMPKSIVAARLPGRAAALSRSNGGLSVRAAGPDDLAAAVALQLELIRWDEQFGAITERPSTPEALRRDLAASLAKEPSWTWIAEVGGRPVGLLRVSPPEEATWIASVVDRAPVAYVSCLVVTAGHRGTGAGASLVAAAHAAVDGAGIGVTLLHYAALSPLSPPFWHRAGYRPLWTTWHARPASRLRTAE
jgi:GNAT superfamily N-acetyltransferase